MIKNGAYTPDEVMNMLEEAAQTERSRPAVRAPGSKGFWPEIVREPDDMGEAEPVHARPSAAQISRYDFVITWTKWLSKYESDLLWMRAAKQSWKKIEAKYGHSRTKMHYDIKVALLSLTHRLNSRADSARSQ